MHGPVSATDWGLLKMPGKLSLFQSAPSRVFIGFCVVLAIAGCKKARPDDALEPNNNFQSATVLTAGQTLTGRANQGNVDVFAFKSEARRLIVFSLQSIGMEDCAAFTVTAPDGGILYQDSDSFCDKTRERAVRAAGVRFAKVKDFGYEIRVPAETAGTYFLSINERGRADNIYPFSWDYRIKADVIESRPADD